MDNNTFIIDRAREIALERNHTVNNLDFITTRGYDIFLFYYNNSKKIQLCAILHFISFDSFAALYVLIFIFFIQFLFYNSLFHIYHTKISTQQFHAFHGKQLEAIGNHIMIAVINVKEFFLATAVYRFEFLSLQFKQIE